MNLYEETHARKSSGGGYKTRNKIMEGGCYQVKVASFTLMRKEVNAI